jgi:alpha/beta superfamily hydrolase
LKLPHEERLVVSGAAGNLEVVVNQAPALRGIAFIAHPHPLYGGSLDNKVVQILAKCFFGQGQVAVRMNFRGVGGSEGVYDEGRGETDDWLRVAQVMMQRHPGLPVLLAGFSFGAFVINQLAQHVTPQRMVLVGPAVNRFPLQPVAPATLVVHGEEDDVVPLEDVLDWARPQSLPVTVMPGAGHFFHGKLVELARIVNHSCSC